MPVHTSTPLQTKSNVSFKRYNESVKPMKKTNLCRIMILIASLVLGATIVFLIVFFTTRKPRAHPPNYPQLDDSVFSSYLTMEKSVFTWSHTMESKLNGQPSYYALLRNQNAALDYLIEFCQRHKIFHVYLYAGCAEWDIDVWRSGSLPLQNELEAAIRKLRDKGISTSLVAYINDDPDMVSNYNDIADVAQLVGQLQRRLGSYYAIKGFLLNLAATSAEAFAHSLEAFALAIDILKGRSGTLEVPVVGMLNEQQLTQEWSFRKELYVGLRVTQIIEGMLASDAPPSRLTYASVLKEIVNVSCVQINSTSDYVQMEYWDTAMDLFKEVRPVTDMTAYGKSIRASPDKFLTNAPHQYNLCQNLNGAGAVCGAYTFSNYALYHEALYTLEPLDSDSRFLYDLYLVNR